MTSIFISFTQQDRAIAQVIAQDLAGRGARVWLDFERLQPGSVDWETSIRDSIVAADYVLYLASPAARASVYVNAEILFAQQNRKAIIPVWVTGESFLDAAPLTMRNFQFLDARGGRLTEVLERLAQTLGLITLPSRKSKILVFLSYASEDKNTVDMLKGDLRQSEVSIWIDHERLKAGEPDWQEAIRRGIQLVDQMVYVASPAARRSPNVNAELMLAHHFKKPIIPFWIAGDSWIDAAVFSLSLTQFIDACGSNYGSAVKQLVQRLELGEESESVDERLSRPL